jgi:N-acetyl sugar amidotransferase
MTPVAEPRRPSDAAWLASSAVRYCTRCVIPETRPGIELGADGVCSACRMHGRTDRETDWNARRERFESLVATVKAKRRPYDCVIPVSGGKDSTWQVATCLEYGLRPLAVTWRPPGRTELGQRNLDNLIGLGVDHIDFSINPGVERRFLLRSLERYGTTAIPMHLAIFNIPLTVAVRYEVPLVVWGENSAAEYIGTGPDADSFRLDREWVRKYGAVHGTTAEDWVSPDLTAEELTPYRGPGDDELAARGVEAVFLGWFFRWDPEKTAEIAGRLGFRANQAGPKTGFYDYADIDDEFISIHHYLKWHKFGFTRSYDNLSLEIRAGRMTRDEAIEILRERGDETPHDDIRAFCDYVGISTNEFFELIERFRDRDIWTRRDGVWIIEDFLIPDFPWGRVPAGA